MASQHHAGDAAGVANTFEWIRVEQDQIGVLPHGNHAALIGGGEELRGVGGGGAERLWLASRQPLILADEQRVPAEYLIQHDQCVPSEQESEGVTAFLGVPKFDCHERGISHHPVDAGE